LLNSIDKGGAVVHGDPIDATGPVLTTRLMRSKRRDGLKRYTLCIDGGERSRS
jgi:acetyl-CoA C-acetyltransferase